MRSIRDGENLSWLAGRWDSVAAVGLAPISDASARVLVTDAALIAELRFLTTAGRFIGDIIRSRGAFALELLDVDDEPIGSAVLHSSGHVSWEELGDDLLVDRPVDLWLLLDRCGLSAALTPLLPLLVDALDLHETDEQLRPALPDDAVDRVMAARRAPVALWTSLARRPSEELADLDDDEVDGLHEKLASAVGDPVERARQLLAWTGSLTWTTEILSGEGPLAMRLLACEERQDVLTAMTRPADRHVVMGGLCWARIAGGDEGVGERLAAGIRAVLSHDG